MNRALRRQQLKEPKPGAKPARASALPRTGPGRPSGSAPARGSFFRPRFATEIISELRKVTWPSRHDVWNLTLVVVIVTIAIGALLGGVDIAFGWLIDQTLLK